MTFWTMLMIKVGAGQGKAAAEAHIKRRTTEEAAEILQREAAGWMPQRGDLLLPTGGASGDRHVAEALHYGPST